MSTERRNTQGEDAEETLGVLDSTGAISTAGIGLLGGATAQVPVTLPSADDEDLVDDDVTEGEAFTDLVLEADPAAFVREDDGIGRIHQGTGVPDIVIEIPAPVAEETVVVAELVEGDETDEVDDEPTDAAEQADADEQADAAEQMTDSEVDDELAEAEAEPAEAADEPAAAEAEAEAEAEGHVDPDAAEAPYDAVATDAPVPEDSSTAQESHPSAPRSPDGEQPERPGYGAQAPSQDEAGTAAVEPQDESETDATEEPAREEPARVEPEAAAAESPVREPAPAPVRAPWPAPSPMTLRPVEPRPTPAAPPASVPRAEEQTVNGDAVPAPETELASRRLDQLGDRERESADLLTADRLLDTSRLAGPEPEGLWSHLLYTISGRRINLGDGKRAQQRKALSARIAAPLPGTARFVPVLSRKGGVGKTTVTALLGMALADAREDRVIAVDANPDRGTLADRIARTNSKTVRDLVRIHDQVTGYHDISAVVSRDATRLDVLASDTDPRVSEAFNDEDYDQVASVAAHYYSLVLTDTGTGIVHSVMAATLDRADTIVIVTGLSVDEARLASETLTWLETNGYADKVREAVVVLNQSSPGSPMVRLSELEAHFRTRVAHVLRVPYDARIAAGSAISFAALQPETRQAARELAAVVVEGLRAQAA
ncbi:MULTISPECIES: MinD/ParA family ATP-binding protein [unclassified Microbacterium]|uniref:MinD/ParA family ATP-binding protein n=1 Tax=unclassified Microbacterium TaxID=2609290 RepID=UPI00301B4150